MPNPAYESMKSTFFASLAIGLLICHSPAKDGDEESPFIGFWKSSDGESCIELQKDGAVNGFGFNMIAAGKWSPVADGKNILLKLTKYGGKLDDKIEATLSEKDQLTLTVQDKPLTFKRVNRQLDDKKLLGTWKASSVYTKPKGVTMHIVETRHEGGKGNYKMIEVSETHKNYHVYESPFQWRTAAGYLIDTFDAGTIDEEVYICDIDLSNPQEIVHRHIDRDSIPVKFVPSEANHVLKPPAGYKKVSAEQFWDLYEHLYADEESETETITEIEEVELKLEEK